MIHERIGDCRTQFCQFSQGWTANGTTSLDGDGATSQRSHVFPDSGHARPARRNRFGIEYHKILSETLRRGSTPTASIGTGDRFAVRMAISPFDSAARITVEPRQENPRPQRPGIRLRRFALEGSRRAAYSRHIDCFERLLCVLRIDPGPEGRGGRVQNAVRSAASVGRRSVIPPGARESSVPARKW